MKPILHIAYSSLLICSLPLFSPMCVPVQAQEASRETPKEAYSRLAPSYHLGNKTIPEMLAESTGDLVIHEYYPLGMEGDGPGPAYPPHALVQMACESSAVILGTAELGVSHPTENRRSVYTEWTFAVAKVFRNDPISPVGDGQIINVVRPGGHLVIDGRNVTVTYTNFDDFAKRGQYLLFLKRVGETGAYTVRSNRVFSIGNIDAVGHLTLNVRYPELERDTPDQLLRDTAAAVSAIQDSKECSQE